VTSSAETRGRASRPRVPTVGRSTGEFDLGFAEGLLRGRTEGLKRIATYGGAREERLHREIRSLVARARLPPDRAVLPLLELAWGLLLGPAATQGRRVKSTRGR